MTLENETTAQQDATERPSRPWRSNVSQRAVAAAAESERFPSSSDEPGEGDLQDGDEATLAELASLMTAVKEHADARYDAMGDQLAELTTRVDALAGRSEDGEDGEEDEPDPASLRSWTARATRQEWEELVRWVDWMQTTYSVAGHSIDPVPPCWPAHHNVAEELAGLHASWLAALTDEANAKGVSDAALYWHDRWLWPTRERLSTSFLERCRAGRHELPRPPHPTNPAFIPDTAADEPPADGQRSWS